MWGSRFENQTGSQWAAQLRSEMLNRQSAIGGMAQRQLPTIAEVVSLKEKIKELEAKLQEPESKKLDRIREHNRKLLERVAYYEKLKED